MRRLSGFLVLLGLAAVVGFEIREGAHIGVAIAAAGAALWIVIDLREVPQ